MTNNPYFGLVLTLFTFLLGSQVKKRVSSPLANPLIISGILIILSLYFFKIPYDHYALGGQYISFLVAPATVALVVPFYKNLEDLRDQLIPIGGGIVVGIIVSMVSILVFGRLLGLDKNIILSILPQSATMAIAMPAVAEFGGDPTLAAMMVSIRGLAGVLLGPYLIRLGQMKDLSAMGAAYGTSAHAFGTSKAGETSEISGAVSGLALALAGLVVVLVLPFFVRFL
ncbi:MAG: LrgB family protein [Tissierellia bacterium]|nr:LrgB family protein [Tissierellia bacterium]